MKKFFALFAVALLSLVSCGESGDINLLDGQWHLEEWNDEKPEFDVYIQFKNGVFDIYQQVYSLRYEHYTGTCSVNNSTLKGSYSDGSSWACDYKFTVKGSELILHSEESNSIKSVYKKCTIPQLVINEATSTRSGEGTPIL